MAALQRLALRGTPKATKAAARYTPAGGAERCGMCRHYVPSSSCARIEGPVSAAGWCQLYSQQVTWRPRAGQDAGLNTGGGPPGATLDLSFMTPGTLDPRITFTRASIGTYFDVTGTLQTAAANAPRWDYNPSTHVLNGLLIEEARTNIVLFSADASTVQWTKGGGVVAAPAVTGAQTTAPGSRWNTDRCQGCLSSGVRCQCLQCRKSDEFNPGDSKPIFHLFGVDAWQCQAASSFISEYTTPDAVTYYRTSVTLTTAWQRAFVPLHAKSYRSLVVSRDWR